MKDRIIKNYVEKLRKEDIINFSKQNGINLNDNEINYIYLLIKERYMDILYNPELIFSDLKINVEEYNYKKVIDLYNLYRKKYQSFL